MNAETLRRWLRHAAAKLHQQRDYLNQLDAAIGDGDQGVNLDRGFSAVVANVETQESATPRQVLSTAGTTLISTVGGASGPLWGTALRRAGAALGEAEEFDIAALATALEAALTGVAELGGAREGEKTMLDALAPAARALREQAESGATPTIALAAARVAAEQGVRATASMQATKGRASYLGERSIGHQDAGATAVALMIAALEQAVTDAG